MAEGKWSKYVITDPKLVTDMANHRFKEFSGFSYPDPVYIDDELIPDADSWLDVVWIWDRTVPEELPSLHSHPFNEIVLLIGSNAQDLSDLGGVVEWGMGEGAEAEKYTLTSTAAIYVPKGLPHGPLVFKQVDRPILNIAIGLQTGGYV
jgi:hypothetical protein